MTGMRDGRYHASWRDPKNSTETPLDVGEQWFGSGTENNLSHVMIAAKSSTDGRIQCWFSVDDGENWDSVLTFPIKAGEGFFKTLVKGNRHYRTSFINDGGKQDFLRIQTDFGTHTAPISPSSGGQLVELAGPQAFTPTGEVAFPVHDRSQEETSSILADIRDELRVMNLHMSQITGATWNKEDV